MVKGRIAEAGGELDNPPPLHCDFRTVEYSTGEHMGEKKWEACRGLGLAFGYNQAERTEDYLTGEQLIALYRDLTARGGNLLINVGPMANATIPDRSSGRFLSWGRQYGVVERQRASPKLLGTSANTDATGGKQRFLRPAVSAICDSRRRARSQVNLGTKILGQVSGEFEVAEPGENWFVEAPGDIHRIEACLTGVAFAPHRHDTYTIGITLSGIQSFTYRGAERASYPGQIVDPAPGRTT